MARGDSIRLAGQTQFCSTHGEELRVVENAVRLFVDPDKARMEIDRLPISNLLPSFWEWDNDSVVSDLRWIAEEV